MVGNVLASRFEGNPRVKIPTTKSQAKFRTERPLTSAKEQGILAGADPRFVDKSQEKARKHKKHQK
jgi:hypothetical protein